VSQALDAGGVGFGTSMKAGKVPTVVTVKLDPAEIRENLETYLAGLDDWIKVHLLLYFGRWTSMLFWLAFPRASNLCCLQGRQRISCWMSVIS